MGAVKRAQCGLYAGVDEISMTLTIERAAPVELRFDGRELFGRVITYGERARDRPERFLTRSFVSGIPEAPLVLQHDRRIVLVEAPQYVHNEFGVELRSRLPPRSAAASLVARGTLGGLSVGFHPLEERQEAGERLIMRAHLDHVGLVDSGSYRSSTVEIRQQFDDVGTWLKAMIPTGIGRPMACRCQGPDCDMVQFKPGSLDLGEGDTLAVGGGGYANVLGSKKRGTLITEITEEGMRVGLTARDTETARRVIENAKVAPIFVRPLLDLDQSEYVDENRMRTFSRASVRAFLIKPTDASEGHRPAEIDGAPPPEPRARRWWL